MSAAPSSRQAQDLVAGLRAAGVEMAAVLPDVWMVPIIDALMADGSIRIIRVAREDEGVGLCAGAYLGGRKAVLIAQNAGFLLSTNALAALTHHHQIPVLMLLIQRGDLGDDQYYQMYKGKTTVPVLKALGIPFHRMESSRNLALIGQALRMAYLSRSPVAILLSRQALKEANP